jgi:hypothetical protein
MPADYIETELPWSRYIMYLAVALDQEEIDSFRFWVLAQQDPKRFTWSSPDKAGTSTPDIGQKAILFAQQKLGAGAIAKGDIWTLARLRGMEPVYQIEKPDGTKVYVDEKGNPVNMSGVEFVPSEKAKQEFRDHRIFVREG